MWGVTNVTTKIVTDDDKLAQAFARGLFDLFGMAGGVHAYGRFDPDGTYAKNGKCRGRVTTVTPAPRRTADRQTPAR